MPVVPTREILDRAFAERYGVAAINVINDLSMEAVLAAAEELKAPVILQTSVKHVKMTGIDAMYAMWVAYTKDLRVPVALHLDHCPDRAVISACLARGWNSVLFDASKLSVAKLTGNKEARRMSPPGRPLVRSVRDLGVQFLDNEVNVTGQDCVSSVVLPGGKTFWIFGDTIEGPFETIRYHSLADVLSNTGSIVPLQDISNGVREFEYLKSPDGQRPRQLLPFLPPEDKATQRLWAVHGTHAIGHLYLYYHKITMDPALDVFEAFTLHGMGLARDDGTFHFERLKAPDGTHELWKGDEPGFGAFVQEVDGYLYLWGCIQPASKSAGDMYLARVRPADIERLAAYEYLVEAPTLERPDIKPVWSRTFTPSACLFSHVPNEMSSSYNPYLGKFISLTTYEREDRLVIRTAPEITGPWSEPEVFHRPAKAKPDSLFNAGKEHPEFAREGGKVIYMTFIDSSVYVPHLVEITLA